MRKCRPGVAGPLVTLLTLNNGYQFKMFLNVLLTKQHVCQTDEAGGSSVCDARHIGVWPFSQQPLSLLQDLGAAAGSKRPTCVIMVKPHGEYQEAYDECLEEVQALPPPI